MKAYISGAISNLPENNEPQFREAEQKLQAMGYETVVPHDLDPGLDRDKATWHDWMRVCIKAQMDCDLVVSLPEPIHSKGADCERKVAQMLNMPVFTIARMRPLALMAAELQRYTFSNAREVCYG